MARFTFDKIEYELVPTSEWTFAESRIAKRVSNGMSVAAVERGVMEADPDALSALVAVSVMRVWKEATERMIVDRLDQDRGPLIRMLEEIHESATAGDSAGEDGPVPPTVPSDPVTDEGTP